MLSAVAEFRRALALWALAIVLALVCAAISPFADGALAAGKSHKSAAKHKKHKKHTKHHKKKRKKKKRKKGGRKPAPAPARPSGGAAPPAPGTTPAPPSSKPGNSNPSQPGPFDGSTTESPLWRGGLETGSFSEWAQLDGNLAERDRYFGVVTSPVVDGRYAFRSTLDANARGSGESGQRSMVLLFPNNVPSNNKSGAYEGGERWYRTHFYFPADFHPSPDSTWNWIVQWHNWPDGPCCSNLAISADSSGGGERVSLRVMGGADAAHPIENNDVITERNPAGFLEWFVGDPVLKRDHWYDSVVHVKWSADPSKGFVEWWLDGHRIVSKAMPTLFWYADNNRNYAGATPGPGQAYYMEGYYRPNTLPNNAAGGPVDTSTATVYFDGAQMGPTPGSVAR
jgi:Polysaccharide lyase